MTIALTGAAFILVGIAAIVYALALVVKALPGVISAGAEAYINAVDARRQAFMERHPPRFVQTPTRPVTVSPRDDGAQEEVDDDEPAALPIGVAPPPVSRSSDVFLNGPRDLAWSPTRNHQPSEDDGERMPAETEAVDTTNYYAGDVGEDFESPVVRATVYAPGNRLLAPPPGPKIAGE